MRSLTTEQLRRLASLTDFPSPYYEEYRDIFLLSFYLIGININDLAHLTTKSISNGRIIYRRVIDIIKGGTS